jgi:hypothetical protein
MKIYEPRDFTEAELEDISMYICTLGNGIADTEDNKVFTDMGDVGYISGEQHIYISELGFVTFCDDLYELMKLILRAE